MGLGTLEISHMDQGDCSYPSELRMLGSDAPQGLYFRGLEELGSDDKGRAIGEFLRRPSVAVVGSRKATAYGERVASEIGYGLAKAGFTVVSGMAVGVDAAAHWGALDASGATIAILGCGLDIAYPRGNRPLLKRIFRTGLVMSEYAPGIQPRAYHFPARNRLISGISDAVVVVEGEKKSGAMITASHALDQGKSVMAVPGSIYSPMSKGTHALIRDGAIPVGTAAEVIEFAELRGQSRLQIDNLEADGKDDGELELLAGIDRDLLVALSFVPESIDILVGRVGQKPQLVLAAAMRLELSGWIKREDGGRYFRVR